MTGSDELRLDNSPALNTGRVETPDEGVVPRRREEGKEEEKDGGKT